MGSQWRRGGHSTDHVRATGRRPASGDAVIRKQIGLLTPSCESRQVYTTTTATATLNKGQSVRSLHPLASPSTKYRCLECRGPSFPSLAGPAPNYSAASAQRDLSLSSYPSPVRRSTSCSLSSSTPFGAFSRAQNKNPSGKVLSILGVARVSHSYGASSHAISRPKRSPLSSVS